MECRPDSCSYHISWGVFSVNFFVMFVGYKLRMTRYWLVPLISNQRFRGLCGVSSLGVIVSRIHASQQKQNCRYSKQHPSHANSKNAVLIQYLMGHWWGLLKCSANSVRHAQPPTTTTSITKDSLVLPFPCMLIQNISWEANCIFSSIIPRIT